MPKRKPVGARWANYLTRQDLQKRLGVSRATIARMHARGELPDAFLWGGVYLYRRSEIEEFEKKWFPEKRGHRSRLRQQTRDRLT